MQRKDGFFWGGSNDDVFIPLGYAGIPFMGDKISKNSFLLWLQEVENFVKKGKTNVQAENAFNVISSQINLKPVYFGNEFCIEVDDGNELEIARKYFDKKNNKKV